MKLKLLIVLIEDDRTTEIMAAAREAGATGATLIHRARGEGLRARGGFLGLQLDACRSVLLLVVSAGRAAHIMERVAAVGQFDESPGTGIAFQLDVEDSVGMSRQWKALRSRESEPQGKEAG